MQTRLVHTKFWEDDYVKSLPHEYRLLYQWMLTNSFVDVLSIIESTNETISEQTGLAVHEVERGLEILSQSGKIEVFRSYVYLKNGYKYQSFNGIKNATPKLRRIYTMGDEAQIFFRKHIGLWMKEISNDMEPYKFKAGYEKVVALYRKTKLRFDYVLEQFEKEQIVDNYTGKDRGISTPITTPSHTGQKTEIRNQKPEIQIRKEKSETETPRATVFLRRVTKKKKYGMGLSPGEKLFLDQE